MSSAAALVASCVSCEAANRKSPATLLLDDAPYCVSCAQDLGFNSVEIAIGARTFGLDARQQEMRERQATPSPKPEVSPQRWCEKCGKIKIRQSSSTGKCTPCQQGMVAGNPKRLALEARDGFQHTIDLPPGHAPQADDVICNIPPAPPGAIARQIGIILEEKSDALNPSDAKIPQDSHNPQETHSEAAQSDAHSQENDVTSAQGDMKDEQPERPAASETGQQAEPRACLSVTNCQIDRMLAGLPLEIKVRMVQEYLDRIAE